MGLLQEILAQKADEVRKLAAARSARPQVASDPRGPLSSPRDVINALRRTADAPLRLIAEIKFRSPSAGTLSRALDASARARVYERGGMAMISVLTDARWFDGSFEHLAQARAAVTVPVLCKDFIIDPLQIAHAKLSGADAVLLIVRCLPEAGHLEQLVASARTHDIEPFVEIVDEAELDRALRVEAQVIGVNARDLDTLQMDAARAERVLARIPADRVAVHLSGLKTAADAMVIARSRADAALLGEALMRQDDPSALLGELGRGAAAPRKIS
jgi:indole-3-glycerol phosphate synthase